MKNLIYLFVLVISSSCSSYDDYLIHDRKVKLAAQDLSSIDGFYQLKAEHIYNYSGTIDTCATSSPDALYQNLRLSGTTIDSNSNYSIQIKTINNKKIKCYLTHDNRIIDSTEISGKISKSGMFHFKNNPIDCHGIPYILGGCSGSKTRIGLERDGDLIVQQSMYSGGAILLILGDHRTYNTAYSFSKINR
jgi:hypothetical protein